MHAHTQNMANRMAISVSYTPDPDGQQENHVSAFMSPKLFSNRKWLYCHFLCFLLLIKAEGMILI
jgi:hypothetical protein